MNDNGFIAVIRGRPLFMKDPREREKWSHFWGWVSVCRSRSRTSDGQGEEREGRRPLRCPKRLTHARARRERKVVRTARGAHDSGSS